MKLQVDMCMCLAETYGYDLESEDSRHLSFLLAGGGTLEKLDASVGVKIASQAGVHMLRQYLQGATLLATKQIFKKVGVSLTKKAMAKALPFGVGVAIGSSANYALTRYVGHQAKTWFYFRPINPPTQQAQSSYDKARKTGSCAAKKGLVSKEVSDI
jgi:uncharacterized protein (DUF697 family)